MDASEEQEILKAAKDRLAVTLSQTVQTIGYAPNAVGDGVKGILAGDDFIAILSLGVYLENSIDAGNYEPLIKGLADIKKHQDKKMV